MLIILPTKLEAQRFPAYSGSKDELAGLKPICQRFRFSFEFLKRCFDAFENYSGLKKPFEGHENFEAR